MRLLLSLIALLALTACSQNQRIQVTANDLVGQNFELISVDGHQLNLKGEGPVTIGFDKRETAGLQLHGVVCNFFNGIAELRDNRLKAQLMMTKRLCAADQLNKMDWIFAEMLEKGVQIHLTNTNLILSTDQNQWVYKKTAP